MSFKMARLHAGNIRPHRELPLAAGAVGNRGALMVKDVNGAWAECDADPAAIGGVAEADFGPDTGGYGGHGTKEFPPGYMTCIPVADEQEFRAQYVGALPAAPGGNFGVIRDVDGKWKVDFNEVVATRVRYIRPLAESPLNVPEVIVVFLAANVQLV